MQCWPIDVVDGHRHTERRTGAGPGREVGRVDEHLRRDAADVDARAAELAVLDDGDVEVVELGSGDRVPRSGADDDEIVMTRCGRHAAFPGSVEQLLEQRGERFAAMADRLLLGARHLGERATIAGRGHEHAVVAEPFVAASVTDDLTVARSLGVQLVAIRPDHHGDGPETGTPVG